MRMFLLLWIGPLGFLGGWYFLSLNDINFGTQFFSRQMHDLVFAIYGNVLGIAPEAIPPLVAKALVVDTALVLTFLAFRRRRKIIAFLRARGILSSALAAQPGETVESALQDEGGRRRIDALGTPGPTDIRFNQNAFGRRGRQALVPEGDRAVVQP